MEKEILIIFRCNDFSSKRNTNKNIIKREKYEVLDEWSAVTREVFWIYKG